MPPPPDAFLDLGGAKAAPAPVPGASKAAPVQATAANPFATEAGKLYIARVEHAAARDDHLSVVAGEEVALVEGCAGDMHWTVKNKRGVVGDVPSSVFDSGTHLGLFLGRCPARATGTLCLSFGCLIHFCLSER